MQKVIKYKSVDGILFDTEEGCLSHEKKLSRRDEILSLLKPFPKESFKGYVQQDINMVSKVKDLILDEILSENPKWEEIVTRARTIPVSHSILGRYLCDSDSVWNYAWSTLMCIDESGRQWNQPYYANHPWEGDDVEYYSQKGKEETI